MGIFPPIFPETPGYLLLVEPSSLPFNLLFHFLLLCILQGWLNWFSSWLVSLLQSQWYGFDCPCLWTGSLPEASSPSAFVCKTFSLTLQCLTLLLPLKFCVDGGISDVFQHSLFFIVFLWSILLGEYSTQFFLLLSLILPGFCTPSWM